MRRVDKTFSSLKKKGEKGLVTFITAGDPDLQTTESLVLKMEEMGADIVELGVPFSDPLADGPVIQKASLRSLQAGTSLKKIIGLVERLRRRTQVPIVLMSSYNPVFCYDEAVFVSDAVSAGVDGIIVPDVPPEEGGGLQKLAERNGLDMIFLVAPTSSPERVKHICAMSSGFLYYMSLTGVTGTRETLADDFREKVTTVKKYSSIPVIIGFGISKPEHVALAGEVADGVVVGSAIVKVIENNVQNKKELIAGVGRLTAELKKGCRN